MLENQDFKNSSRLESDSKPPHLTSEPSPSNPERKSWWSKQNILTKVLTVILSLVALFVVTEILEQVERALYQAYKVGVWVFAGFAVIFITLSIFKKN
ncbi:hypothetical protein SAMN06295967_102324 [Belliella buryatensis]|uniref:Uncharacterized protein n=1 Tax=Belliella buryatensis TaxID=1500549 RepID=A0A239BH33_9BACT|nr:hypothetical protein [Belliella buryatensis]SNS06333.1 hypothetical protein SAMN06295967_102324 [Belliella buryatensis]